MALTIIDTYINRFLPANVVNYFPQPLKHFLGYRKTPRTPPPEWIHWLDILIGTFCGVLVLEAVFKSHTVFSNHHAPIIIASYGATAILLFNSIEAPLGQPRNILFGQFISSLVGVCISKLFQLSNMGDKNLYLGGALSVGLASIAMSFFNCVHPPAGASALMPCVEESIKAMGWWYLPMQLVSSVLIIGVACITNNLFRTYPKFWWSPLQMRTKPNPIPEKPLDIEQSFSNTNTTGTNHDQEKEDGVLENQRSDLIQSKTRSFEIGANIISHKPNIQKIEINRDSILIPNELKQTLSSYEIQILENIRLRINETFNSSNNNERNIDNVTA